MLQFRPGGPLYDENDVGWVFRNSWKFVCRAQDVRVGDLLPNCELFDEADPTIRVLMPVREIVEVHSEP